MRWRPGRRACAAATVPWSWPTTRSSRPATTAPPAVMSTASTLVYAIAAGTGITTAITTHALRYTPR
nr:MAG TPA: hypothetical protein [Caudoviricetes sp.]